MAYLDVFLTFLVHNSKLLLRLLSRLTQICSVLFFSQLCKPINEGFPLFNVHCLLLQSCCICIQYVCQNLCPLFLIRESVCCRGRNSQSVFSD
ncbi:hypothetical protein VNO78_14154 [Psophocarpus tetragonolobus]|uniref:Uncharacterized protein n=1 Tax=Psophocarpus tetragonolobus TaxID=3891 RepID=A0AAN9SPU7_PSOTE